MSILVNGEEWQGLKKTKAEAAADFRERQVNAQRLRLQEDRASVYRSIIKALTDNMSSTRKDDVSQNPLRIRMVERTDNNIIKVYINRTTEEGVSDADRKIIESSVLIDFQGTEQSADNCLILDYKASGED